MAKFAVIPSSWLGALGTWSAEPLVKLAGRVAEAGVDPQNTDAVLTVARSEDAKTEAKLADINGELRDLDARVQTLRAAKKALSPIIPRDGRFKKQ